MNSSDPEINMAALATEPAQKLLHQAAELFQGLSERDLGQVLNYIQKSGQIDLEDFEKLLEELGFVKVGKFTAPEQKSAQGKDTQWQDKVKDKVVARMHNPHKDKYASLELRLLPPVRKLVDYYAAGKGMVAAECVESIVVDALNNNPDILEKGEKRLKEFGGNLTRAKRHAVEEKLARLQALEAGSSSRRR